MHSYTGLYTAIQSYTQLYKTILYSPIQSYAELYTAVQGYTKL